MNRVRFEIFILVDQIVHLLPLVDTQHRKIHPSGLPRPSHDGRIRKAMAQVVASPSVARTSEGEVRLSSLLQECQDWRRESAFGAGVASRGPAAPAESSTLATSRTSDC